MILERKRLFTVDDYHRMGAEGIFGPEERVELIEGEVVQMSPIGSTHAACVNRLNYAFIALTPKRAIISIQNSLRLSALSEPEPDVVLLKPRADFYSGSLPGPSDALLVIEVADTTFAFDQSVKGPLYAKSGVIEYWLINLNTRVVHVHRNPTATGYADVQQVDASGMVHPLAFADLSLPTSSFLP